MEHGELGRRPNFHLVPLAGPRRIDGVVGVNAKAKLAFLLGHVHRPHEGADVWILGIDLYGDRHFRIQGAVNLKPRRAGNDPLDLPPEDERLPLSDAVRHVINRNACPRMTAERIGEAPQGGLGELGMVIKEMAGGQGGDQGAAR